MKYNEKQHKDWVKAHKTQKQKDTAFEEATIMVSMIAILVIMTLVRIIDIL